MPKPKAKKPVKSVKWALPQIDVGQVKVSAKKLRDILDQEREQHAMRGLARHVSAGKRQARRTENKGIRDLWIAEARKRLQELRSGAVKGIPGEEVFASLRKKYLGGTSRA